MRRSGIYLALRVICSVNLASPFYFLGLAVRVQTYCLVIPEKVFQKVLYPNLMQSIYVINLSSNGLPDDHTSCLKQIRLEPGQATWPLSLAHERLLAACYDY